MISSESPLVQQWLASNSQSSLVRKERAGDLSFSPAGSTHPKKELQAAAGGEAHVELVPPASGEMGWAGEKWLLGERSQETWV